MRDSATLERRFDVPERTNIKISPAWAIGLPLILLLLVFVVFAIIDRIG